MHQNGACLQLDAQCCIAHHAQCVQHCCYNKDRRVASSVDGPWLVLVALACSDVPSMAPRWPGLGVSRAGGAALVAMRTSWGQRQKDDKHIDGILGRTANEKARNFLLTPSGQLRLSSAQKKNKSSFCWILGTFGWSFFSWVLRDPSAAFSTAQLAL